MGDETAGRDGAGAIRHTVWNSMLDAARVTMYAEMMGTRYRKAHALLRFGLLLSATASAVAILNTLPDSLRLVPNLTITALIIWDLVADYGTKIAALNSAKRECQILEQDWRDLWDDIDTGRLPSDRVRERNRELLLRLHRATGPMDEHVKVSERVNGISTARAYKVMEEQYAAR